MIGFGVESSFYALCLWGLLTVNKYKCMLEPWRIMGWLWLGGYFGWIRMWIRSNVKCMAKNKHGSCYFLVWGVYFTRSLHHSGQFQHRKNSACISGGDYCIAKVSNMLSIFSIGLLTHLYYTTIFLSETTFLFIKIRTAFSLSSLESKLHFCGILLDGCCCCYVILLKVAHFHFLAVRIYPQTIPSSNSTAKYWNNNI